MSDCAPVQQDVGLAAHDAGGRARRVEQDRVERRAVPPGVRVARHRPQQRASTPSARRVEGCRARGAAARASMSSAVTRSDGSRSSRCAVLPPGAAQASSTRAPRRRRQRIGHALRGAVLHRDRAVREAGQRRRPAAAASRRSASRQRRHRRRRAMPASLQARQVGVARRRSARFTRSHIGGVAARWRRRSRRPASGQSSRERCAQPVRPLRAGIGRRQAFALCAPQQRVDQPGLVRRGPARAPLPRWQRPPHAPAGPADRAGRGRHSSSARSSSSRRPSGFGIHCVERRVEARRAGAARRSRSPRPARGRAGRPARAGPRPARPSASGRGAAPRRARARRLTRGADAMRAHASREVAAGVEVVGGGDRPAAFALQHADAQHALAAGDVDAVAAGAQHACPARRACACVQRDRAVDAQALAGELRLGHRPRIEGAHLVGQRARPAATSRAWPRPCRACARRSRPPPAAAAAAGGCRRAAGPGHRPAPARRARPGGRAAGRRFRPRRSASACDSSTGPVSRPFSICIRHTPVSRVAGLDRALDRRRAAPARQQRGVHVPAAVRAGCRAPTAAGSGRRRPRPSGRAAARAVRPATPARLKFSGCSTGMPRCERLAA